jgi:hypothetical protein
MSLRDLPEMPDQPELITTQKEALEKLRKAIIRNHEDLHAANERKSISTVAWLHRNILELWVWTEYCSKSPQHAHEFALDAGRDACDALEILDTDDARATAEAVRNTALSRGFTSITRRYTTTSDAAKEIGQKALFTRWNKVMSKFAHPTAIFILGDLGEHETRFREQFYSVGCYLATKTVAKITHELGA